MANKEKRELMLQMSNLFDQHGTKAVFDAMREALEMLSTCTNTATLEKGVVEIAKTVDGLGVAIVDHEKTSNWTMSDGFDMCADYALEN